MVEKTAFPPTRDTWYDFVMVPRLEEHLCGHLSVSAVSRDRPRHLDLCSSLSTRTPRGASGKELMRSCLYLSLIAFTSGFVFRFLKVKVVFSRWSCSFFRVCCATLAHQAECSRLLRAHLWNLPRRGEAQHFARGHLLRVHLHQVHALAGKRRSCGTTFFLSRVFPELTPHRFRTHFVQNLLRRHTLTAFSNRISCSTPLCVRFGLYQKIFNNGHALLAVRPATNPASTCRDAFVSVACLSLKGEESGTVIGDPECSSGLFRSPLKVRLRWGPQAVLRRAFGSEELPWIEENRNSVSAES